MKVPSRHLALQEIAVRLAELVGVDPNSVRPKTLHGSQCVEIIESGPFAFVVEWTGSGMTARVATAIEHVRRHSVGVEGAIPIVAVPFMGEAGRKRCEEANAAWLDLSGNARIFAPGLRILVEGKPNQFKRRGRPSSSFAPKSSRITRWLLMHPHESLTQREIARATKTDEGYTSKIVSNLEKDGLIIKDESGALKLRDPDLLLDAWREDYDFTKHHIIRGHVVARSGDVLLRHLAEFLREASVGYAVTGLAAAWLLDRFAAFRITTLYLNVEPSSGLLDSISFRKDERGANVWLVVPNDEGVFHGAYEVDGVRCVHPLQVYLDLESHPERADEAARKLRATHLNWRING